MKSLITALSVTALSALAVPALAQTSSPSYYLNLGDTYLAPDHGSLNEITGRMGARLGPNFGLEGEIGGSTNSSNGYLDGAAAKVHEDVAGAGYAVGFLPLGSNFDVLARVGYGENSLHASRTAPTGPNGSHTYGSVNYGAGAQYMLTANDGVRGDYTRRDYQGSGGPGGADTWSMSWVHKF
jgi:hypothetical protein